MIWEYAVPCLLVSIGALFVIAALLDARERRRFKKFSKMTFRRISRETFLREKLR